MRGYGENPPDEWRYDSGNRYHAGKHTLRGMLQPPSQHIYESNPDLYMPLRKIRPTNTEGKKRIDAALGLIKLKRMLERR